MSPTPYFRSSDIMLTKASVVKVWNSSTYKKNGRRALGSSSALLNAARPIVETIKPPSRFAPSSQSRPLARFTMSVPPSSIWRRKLMGFVGATSARYRRGSLRGLPACFGSARRPLRGIALDRPRTRRSKSPDDVVAKARDHTLAEILIGEKAKNVGQG